MRKLAAFLAVICIAQPWIPEGARSRPQSSPPDEADGGRSATHGTSIAAFGATTGTGSTTCTATAGSAVLSCESAGDFLTGHGIRLNHAGPAYTGTPPRGLAAKGCGGVPVYRCETGATTYTYQVVAIDGRGGYSAASPAARCDDGPPRLSVQSWCTVTFEVPSSGMPGGYAILRAVGTETPVPIRLVNAGILSFNDYGPAPIAAPDWFPSAPPTTPAASWLITTIRSGGTSTPTLSEAASSTSTAAMLHDNAPNINAALASATAVEVPAGTFLIGESVRVPSGSSLFGRDRHASRLLFSTGMMAPHFSPGIDTTGATDVSVHDLTIDPGVWDSPQSLVGCAACSPDFYRLVIPDIPTGGIGIYVGGAMRPRIHHNVITMKSPSGEYNQCINVTKNGAVPSVQGRVDFNTCTGSGIDALAQDTSISHNEISGNLFGGVIVTEIDPLSRRYRIAGNSVASGATLPDTNDTCPEGIENWAPDSTIVDNMVFDNCGGGIAQGGQNAVVTGNQVFDNKGSGIVCRMVAAAPANCSGSIFTGNRAYNTGVGQFTQDCGYNEIGRGSSMALVEGNAFDGNARGNYCDLTGKTYIPLIGSAPWTTTIGANGGLTGTNIGVPYARPGMQVALTYAPGPDAPQPGIVSLLGEVLVDNDVQVWAINNGRLPAVLRGTLTAVLRYPRGG